MNLVDTLRRGLQSIWKFSDNNFYLFITRKFFEKARVNRWSNKAFLTKFVYEIIFPDINYKNVTAINISALFFTLKLWTTWYLVYKNSRYVWKEQRLKESFNKHFNTWSLVLKWDIVTQNNKVLYILASCFTWFRNGRITVSIVFHLHLYQDCLNFMI